jgi:hypothetical protein
VDILGEIGVGRGSFLLNSEDTVSLTLHSVEAEERRDGGEPREARQGQGQVRHTTIVFAVIANHKHNLPLEHVAVIDKTT